MALSSLRFTKCTKETGRFPQKEYVEFGGFANTILEHVFRIPRGERGMINYVVYSYAIETEPEILDRIARVGLIKGGKDYAIYVFAEASTKALREWRVTGRSILMDGISRMPKAEEMIWLE